MSRRTWWLPMVALAGAGGCAVVRPDRHIDQAAGLVEERTGYPPDWTVPWDDAPPLWDGQSVLRLEDAVALALRNNRQLRADLEMIGQAHADLVQAGLLQNPRFNFMMMFPDGGGRSMLRSSAMPMQPLQDLWLIPTRKQVAAAELQQAVLRVADRAVETAAAVKRTYARLQYTQRAADLIRDNMQTVEQSTRIIQIRQTAGQATQVSVNLARIRYLRLQSEVMSTEAEYRTLQRELLLLIGFADATDSWRVEPVQEMTAALEAPADETDLWRLAAEQRLDLQAAQWNVQAAKEQIELMRREGWPDIALAFSLERVGGTRARTLGIPSRAGNAVTQNLVDQAFGMPPAIQPPMVEPFRAVRRDMKYTMGPMIEMEIPIFDQNQAQVAKAVHEWRQRVAEYEAQAQEVVRQVREARVTYAQAWEQVRFFRDAVLPEVERNLALAQQSFVAGQEDLTIYLQVQEDLIMTRLRTLEFLRDYLVSRADLERQVGGRLGSPSPTGPPVEEAASTQAVE